jgi:hypothetical protein
MIDNSFPAIMPDGWKCLFLELTSKTTIELEFPDLIAETSLDYILEELIIPPEPDHIKVLWGMYNPGESIPREIHNCLDRGEAKHSWKRIAKILEDTSNERLYQIASQNAYRLEYVCDHESQKILQSYNNILVECLTNRWINPLQIDLEIKAVCDRQGISFKTYKLLDLILEYYRLLLPYPYRLRDNREMFTDYTKYDAPEALKQRFDNEVFSRRKRLKERFSFYKYGEAAMNGWYMQMDEKSKQEFDLILDRSNIENGTDYERSHATRVSNPRNSFVRLLPMMESAGNLFQCPFCYHFSSKGLPKGSNQFPSHCDQPECKTTYKNWSRKVQRAGSSAGNKAEDSF